MPALTVKAVTKALSDYVRPDEDIVAKLNMVMPRLYAMGMWRDLLYDWSIETTNDYFALPEHSESLIGAMLENSPVEMQSQWHDYRISGYASEGPAPIFGVIDDGFHPVKEDVIYDGANYEVNIEPISPNSSLPTEGDLTLLFSEGGSASDASYSAEVALGGQNSLTAYVNELNEDATLESISYSGITEAIRVVAVKSGDPSVKLILAEIRGDGVVRYRRFRFANSSGQTKNIKLLLKRAWQTVLTQDDIIYLGNLNAIKHGLLGMLAEDNADLERAQYHWTICRQLLDEELDAARGAAKPKPILKPVGNQINIPNII